MNKNNTRPNHALHREEAHVRKLMNRIRATLYPHGKTERPVWKVALGALCCMTILSACVRVYGLKAEILGFPVPMYAVWVIINIYLLVGIVWNLLAPDDPVTADMKNGRRLLFVGIAVFCVALGLAMPVLRGL